MKRLFRWLDENFEEVLMALFLCGVVIMMTIHVFFRYVLRTPLTWSEEATRYLFIWFVFVGISYGIKNDTHIRVNIIETLYPKVIPVFSLIQDIVSAAFIFYMLPGAMSSMQYLATHNRLSAGLHIPMTWIYGALAAGLFFSVLRIIQKFALRFIGWMNQSKSGEGRA